MQLAVPSPKDTGTLLPPFFVLLELDVFQVLWALFCRPSFSLGLSALCSRLDAGVHFWLDIVMLCFLSESPEEVQDTLQCPVLRSITFDPLVTGILS